MSWILLLALAARLTGLALFPHYFDLGREQGIITHDFSPATCWRHLKRLRRYVASGRLLGVGCATMFFSDEACVLGWNVEGVDISAFGVEYARKRFSLEVNHGELTDLSLLEGLMDQVTMWNVIEYVSDLAAYVQCLARGVREVKETLGVSTQALYINPLDIIQVTARLR